MEFIDWIIILVCTLFISIVAMQETKQGLSDALTGASSELFKNQKQRGSELFLARATYALGILFILLCAARYVFF